MNDPIEYIRERWSERFGDGGGPSIHAQLVSAELKSPYNNMITRGLTIVEPDGTEYTIEMYEDKILSYSMVKPGSERIFDKGPTTLFDDCFNGEFKHWEEAEIEPEPEKPKKVIHRRIILD